MKALIICSPLLLLSGCSSLSSEHVQTIAEVLSKQVTDGNLTQAQFDAVMGALQGIVSGDWTAVLVEIANGALTLAAGYLGIRYWRGPVTARKGLPPSS